jgi:RNA polymerase sigma-70 factor (sigma-E family)
VDTASSEEFRAFVAANNVPLLRTAYLLTGDRQLAEDLVQNALLRVYRRWARISRLDRPEAYVRKVLVNERRSAFRRRRVAEDLRPVPPERPGADDAARHAERDELLGELQKLPPRTRAVLVLRYWDDISEADTAELLGCSVGTVKSQASRGLARLRASLAGSPSDQTLNGEPR